MMKMQGKESVTTFKAAAKMWPHRPPSTGSGGSHKEERYVTRWCVGHFYHDGYWPTCGNTLKATACTSCDI